MYMCKSFQSNQILFHTSFPKERIIRGWRVVCAGTCRGSQRWPRWLPLWRSTEAACHSHQEYWKFLEVAHLSMTRAACCHSILIFSLNSASSKCLSCTSRLASTREASLHRNKTHSSQQHHRVQWMTIHTNDLTWIIKSVKLCKTLPDGLSSQVGWGRPPPLPHPILSSNLRSRSPPCCSAPPCLPAFSLFSSCFSSSFGLLQCTMCTLSSTMSLYLFWPRY